MKYVIWGAGIRGQRLLQCMGEDAVEVFVDQNKKGYCCGKKIISLDEYEQYYSKYVIIISFLNEAQGIKELNERGIETYFLLSDCPGEYQEPRGRVFLLKRNVLAKCKREGNYIVKGCSLYALMLCQWIKENGNQNVILWIEEGVSKNLRDVIESNGIQLIEEIDRLAYVKLFICEYTEYSLRKKQMQKWKNVEYIYDCSYEIVEYYNPKIEKYKNKHVGERCFIIATGPSLKMKDLELLKKNNEICISMNGIWHAYKQTDWRPSYYVAEDYRVMDNYAYELENMDNTILFIGDTSQQYCEKQHGDNIWIHHFNYEYSEARLPEFSENFARACYMGSTVTYSCIQLAVYMGFKEIYLLGVDFSYGESEKSEKYGHFFKESKLEAIGFVKQVRLAYIAAKEYADKHEIKIYNATRGGKLEIFERVDFDLLFPK